MQIQPRLYRARFQPCLVFESDRHVKEVRFIDFKKLPSIEGRLHYAVDILAVDRGVWVELE
ncbi:Unknown protein sequence [Pseudomonas amygdali pv. lachrymans]|nr:Unknown protein sequence [Pseudomonas amygdali pv. lachrymans]